MWYQKALRLAPSLRLKLNLEDYELNGKHRANGTCVTEDVSFPLQFHSNSIDFEI